MLHKILKWTAISSVFATLFIPFIVSDNLFFPFITGKNFIFRIIVEIGLAAWLLLTLRDASARPRKSYLLWAFVAFTVIIGLADVFGQNFWKSFWSNFERMEGYITILHLFAYFIVASSVLATERLWKLFIESAVWTSAVVSFYSILQLSGILAINQGGVRVDATFGNATYLAIYLVFNIFFALTLIVRDPIIWKKAVYTILVGAQMTILYHTATRGSMLGLLGGLILSALLIVFFDRAEKTHRIIAGSVLGVLALIVVGFLAVKDKPFVANSLVLSRFASISWNDTKTQARAYIWPMVFEGFKQHPVLGWGQENFNHVFNANYDPRMYRHEQWFDRAHNVVFDWLIAGGALGLLSYLSLFGFALYLLWRKTTDMSFAEKALFTGLGAGYFFHNLFVFDNIGSYILFVMVLAYIQFKSTRLEVPIADGKQEIDDSEMNIAGPIIVVVLICGIYFLNWRGYATSASLIETLRYSSANPVPAQLVLTTLEKTLAYDTLGRPEVMERVVEMSQRMNTSDVPLEIRRKFREVAEATVETQLRRFPNDARYEVFAGSFYSMYGEHDKALLHFTNATKLSPNKQSILFQLGNFHIAYKEYEQAVEVFKKAYDLEHAHEDAAKYYAISLLYVGRDAEAEKFLTERFGTSDATSDMILQVYASVGKWDRVIAFLKARILLQPNNVTLVQYLVSAYLQSGNKTAAIGAIRDMVKANPGLKDAGDQAIKAIEAGKTF